MRRPEALQGNQACATCRRALAGALGAAWLVPRALHGTMSAVEPPVSPATSARAPPPPLPRRCRRRSFQPTAPLLTAPQTTLVAKAGKGSNPKTALYVGGLESTVNEAALHAAFLPFGEIKEVGQAFVAAALHMLRLCGVSQLQEPAASSCALQEPLAPVGQLLETCTSSACAMWSLLTICAGVAAAGPRHGAAPRLWLRGV